MKVYDLPQDILSTIQPKDEQNTASVATDDPTDVVEAHSIVSARQDDGVFASSSKSCSLCGVSFNTVEEQRGHTRSDFHNYNLKQKLRGFKPVSENDFEALMGGWCNVNHIHYNTDMLQIWMKVYQDLMSQSLTTTMMMNEGKQRNSLLS